MMRKRLNDDDLMINHLEESKQSTKDILTVLNDTKGIATDTLIDLQEQGQQIKHIQGDVDTIRDQQAEAKKKVRTIASIFWDLIYSLFPSVKRRRHASVGFSQSTVPSHTGVGQKPSRFDTDSVISGSLNDEKAKLLNNTVEDYLDQINQDVHDLHGVAIEMGVEVDQQNMDLDCLTKDTNAANQAMGDLTTKIRRL